MKIQIKKKSHQNLLKIIHLRHGVADSQKTLDINENQEKNISGFRRLDINLLNDKNGQPFKIREDTNDFKLLKESIEILGITNPLQVVENGSMFDVIEGHRRLYIAKMLGFKEVDCIVIEKNKDKNNLQLVDGNITARQKLLTSENVKAYKLKFESMQNLGRSPKQEIADEENTSVRTVERYLKLSTLTDTMLDLIDEFETSKKFGFSMKVGTVFTNLSEEQQQIIEDYIIENEVVIDEKQAKEIIKLEPITKDSINQALNKKNKVDKRKNISIPYKRIKDFFSEETSEEERIEIIIKALENFTNKVQ